MKYVWLIRNPGSRRGAELWLGPLGLPFTYPLQRIGWAWGWWRI